MKAHKCSLPYGPGSPARRCWILASRSDASNVARPVAAGIMDDLDEPDDRPVEFVEFLGRYPQFEDVASARLLDRVPGGELAVDLEPGDIADAGGGHVPVPGDHDGVLLVQHRVEDRLIRQARRPRLPAGGPD